MKKILSFLSVVFAIFALSGCGGTRLKYDQCVEECRKNIICIEKAGREFKPGAPNCKKYSDTTQCTYICIEKYK